ncbi:SIR2 family protein [Sinorhizobium meliloti]|uniref:SIR2 family protein n=1 Tax=Rhizobium meliloti TaxID=382 RepID=UPI000FDA092F|nr:SIR2 family protein [Sinorhizobium meliloti]RVQ55868.1 SIR2 family protein [Sinorhizobium meliloti]
MQDYTQYKEDIVADVKAVIEKLACLPIFFVGSGFSKRLCGAPNWEELLKELRALCPNCDGEIAYYRQKGIEFPAIGSILAEKYNEWAWSPQGRTGFPEDYFSPSFPLDIFLKHSISQLLTDLKFDESVCDANISSEVELMKACSPHAIITTNYDLILDNIFSDYTPIIGQQVVRNIAANIGEIFKIHGCVSDPSSLVLTEEDYKSFEEDKKYLTAKLLAFFAEHPLLFIGYSADDRNIKDILYVVNKLLCENGQLYPENIYFLEWASSIDASTYPVREKIIDIGEGKSFRIKAIVAQDFGWVFKAFSSEEPLEKIDVKMLRNLTNRIVEVSRTNDPKIRMEFDFKILHHLVDNPKDIAKVYGVAALDNPALVNVTHPYLPAEAAEAIQAGMSWNKLYKYVDQIEKQTGYAIRSTDTKLHVNIKPARRYSQLFIDLMKDYIDNGNLPDFEIIGLT